MPTPVYSAVRHILTAPVLAGRCNRYIGDHDFAWEGLDAEVATMSQSQALLVGVARDLWRGDRAVGLWELPQRLGPSGFDRVIEAMHLYRDEGRSAAA